jgi:hypothetical protein
MSLGAAPNPNGDDVSPINGDSVASTTAPAPAPAPAQVDPNARLVHDVINSEVRTGFCEILVLWELTSRS